MDARKLILLVFLAVIFILIVWVKWRKRTRENFSISPVYNPFIALSFPLNRMNQFKVKPKKDFIKTRYYAIYKNSFPNLGACGAYKIANDTLHHALNLAILKPEYGIMVYDNNNQLAYYYPYGNYENGTAIKLEDRKGLDTYFKI